MSRQRKKGNKNAVAERARQTSSLVTDPVSRRGFMKLMGASMALVGLAGCTGSPTSRFTLT
jgi:hypothetical protein